MASRISRVKRARTSPAMTRTFQGWMLLPLGARLASASRSSTVARATGVGRKARTDLRVAIAASASRQGIASAAASLASGIEVLFHGLQAFRDLAQEQALHVVVVEQLAGSAR